MLIARTQCLRATRTPAHAPAIHTWALPFHMDARTVSMHEHVRVAALRMLRPAAAVCVVCGTAPLPHPCAPSPAVAPCVLRCEGRVGQRSPLRQHRQQWAWLVAGRCNTPEPARKLAARQHAVVSHGVSRALLRHRGAAARPFLSSASPATLAPSMYGALYYASLLTMATRRLACSLRNGARGARSISITL